MKTAFIVSLASASFSSVAIAASANPVAHVLVDNSKSSTTIFVPIGTIYTDEKVYKDTGATEPAGKAFTGTSSALLSTNSVQVGSIKCLSSGLAGNTTSTAAPSASQSANGTAVALLQGQPVQPARPMLPPRPPAPVPHKVELRLTGAMGLC
ncbi:hypothetical protein GQ53DRAFT_775542 [Thozetella sp. PMI_491]|nr:hypothetical protein GQ53DRAFT_775542 [Thozetella sp. PMI_491]